MGSGKASLLLVINSIGIRKTILLLHKIVNLAKATITHSAIYRPDSFVLMLRYCANLKAIRYESTSLNRIVADKSHRVIAS